MIEQRLGKVKKGRDLGSKQEGDASFAIRHSSFVIFFLPPPNLPRSMRLRRRTNSICCITNRGSSGRSR